MRHQEGSGGGTAFRGFLKLTGRSGSILGVKLQRRNVPWTGRFGRRLLEPCSLENSGAPTCWTYDKAKCSSWWEWMMLCNPV
eukprot:357862-Chlamydomonas_euryale.AAC.7